MPNRHTLSGIRRWPAFFAVILLFSTTAAGLSAQASVFDVSNARVHVAGPDVLYFDGLMIAGEPYLAYLAADESGTWRITNLEPQRDALVPTHVVLDLAELSVAGDGSLVLSHVFLDGRFYTGQVRFDEGYEEVEDYRFTPSAPPELEGSQLLQELVAFYAAPIPGDPPVRDNGATVAPGTESGAASPPGLPEMEARLREEIQSAAAAVRRDLAARLDRYAELGDQRFSGLARQLREGPVPTALPDDLPPTGSAAVDAAVGRIASMLERMSREGERRFDRLEERLAELSQQIEDTAARIDERANQLLDEIAAAGGARESGPDGPARSLAVVDAYAPTVSLSRARAEMTQVVRPNLDAGEAHRGRWVSEAPDRIVQADPAARFAKLRIGYDQDSRPRLYRFIARALDEGWAGVGLHLSVEDVATPRGYGHGKSILIWLTRDAAEYGVDTTFLEVYVSSDDVNMNRVAQAAIDSQLSAPHAVEVLFDPGANIVTMAVNGVEYLRYRLTLPAESSVEVALRALGRGEFRDLEIRSRP